MVSLRTINKTDQPGPRCPGCSCQHSHEVAQFEWFGQIQSKRQCRNCQRLFVVAIDDPAMPAPIAIPPPTQGLTATRSGAVGFSPTRAIRCVCPECGRENPKVVRTVPSGSIVIRYHKCQDCETSFKSTEQV